jgi:DNA-directed RNA polymerase specialized sigma subunit
VHEVAIVKYANSVCNVERTKLYKDFIQPAFNELVDKITFTYKFTSLPNIDSLRDECKIWLTTILDKYDPNKGSKAFSYFSVITKNWFIHKVKKNSKQIKREIHLDDVSATVEKIYISTTNEYEHKREKQEFWAHLLDEIDQWHKIYCENNTNPNSNDLKVLLAVRELLSNPDEVEILNKKAIYLYLREITGLSTKQIASSLKKIRTKYRLFKEGWSRGDV